MSVIDESAEHRPCVHQVFRSGRIREFRHLLPLYVDFGLVDYGMGNCLECETDGHNGRCPCYTPVTLHCINVTEKTYEESVKEEVHSREREPALV